MACCCIGGAHPGGRGAPPIFSCHQGCPSRREYLYNLLRTSTLTSTPGWHARCLAGAAAAPASSTVIAASSAKPSQHQRRLVYVDWLRVVLTVLVVIMHGLDLYYTGATGGFLGLVYPLPPAGIANMIAWFVLRTTHAYCMALFIFLAGYFVGPSFDRKGPDSYLAGRTRRLLLPLAVYELALQPAIFAIAQVGQGAGPSS